MPHEVSAEQALPGGYFRIELRRGTDAGI